MMPLLLLVLIIAHQSMHFKPHFSIFFVGVILFSLYFRKAEELRDFAERVKAVPNVPENDVQIEKWVRYCLWIYTKCHICGRFVLSWATI